MPKKKYSQKDTDAFQKREAGRPQYHQVHLHQQRMRAWETKPYQEVDQVDKVDKADKVKAES